MRLSGVPRVSGISWTILRALLFAAWAGVVVWGMMRLVGYSFEPGQTGHPRETWPAATLLERDPDSLTLVMALHPECPCSRAAVEQLDMMLAQDFDRVRVIALFVGDGGEGRNSELGQRVARLPRTHVVEDLDGCEARLFDFRTSGETRLYWPDGTLCFSGGITPSRGHVGANPGSRFIVAAAHSTTRPERTAAAVFGCALFANPVERNGR